MPFGIGNRRRNAAARAHETDALLARDGARASEVPRAEHPTDSGSTPKGFGGRVALGRAFALLACAACGVCAYSYNTAPYTLIATLERFALGTHTRSITFRVYTCGIPDAVYDKHVPWPVCRVQLVGCPGGGATCGHWRYAKGIEMTPTTENRNVFEVTTDRYGTGDVYGFAVVEAGCNVEDETNCERGSDGDCKDKNICDHRYDSGTKGPTNVPHKDTNITCWEGERCSSASPLWHPIRSHKPGSKSCMTVFGDTWWNRVVPPRERRIQYVWGTCQHEPADPSICAEATVPNVCNLLETTQPVDQPIEAEAVCQTESGDAQDGTVCRITHDKPGIKSMSVESTCCGGSCCALGQVCNKDTSRCESIAATLAATDMACPDPWYPQIYGVCTQSCGSGNPDCDATCGAAQDAGLTLNCVLGSEGSDRCLCSNVGGHTANECQNAANPGYKCCTCKSIVGQSNNNGNNGNNGNGHGAGGVNS